jgi:DNA repair photolyase
MPEKMVRYSAVKTSGKVLNLYKTPDSWFWLSGSINPYRGCEHNCKYCDGKAEYYRVDQFSSHIKVKLDSHMKFTKELLKLGFTTDRQPSLDNFINMKEFYSSKTFTPHSIIAIGGGVCDVYQQAEAKYKITRKLLKIAKSFHLPISILTKSDLVVRDIQIIKSINEQAYANVSFSITLFDDNVRKIFEPNSSSTSKRFLALEKFRKEDIPSGVMFMPIIPGIGDSEENLKSIIYQSQKSGAEFILPSGMTLKPGRNKEEMLKTIQANFPHLLPLYTDLYGNNNKYGIPNISFEKHLNPIKLVHEYCRKINLPDRIPRYIAPNTIQENLFVSTILFNIAHYYQYVEEYPWRKVVNFSNGGKAVELSPKSIRDFRRNELLEKLTKDEIVLNTIEEILQTGKSSILLKYQNKEDIFVETPKIFED